MKSLSKALHIRWLGIFGLAIGATACTHMDRTEPPTPAALAEGAWLIPGSFPHDRQPDGNTIVFQGATGLIVMDTGRHAWHRQAILDFADARKQAITAIVNSHWHLDHTSGNAAIKRAYPQAKLYTGNAVNRMIREVWPQSVPRSQERLDKGEYEPGLAEDVRGDIETRRNPSALAPDVPIVATQMLPIDGRDFAVHLAPNAATQGDVWLYDPATRIAAVGDLVTLPVPFLDTACVAGWRAALAEVEATPFITLIPGHGAAMDRAQFRAYRGAFDRYTTCALEAGDKHSCAAAWLGATAALRAPEAPDDSRAREKADEYVDLLRENGGNAPLCGPALEKRL